MKVYKFGAVVPEGVWGSTGSLFSEIEVIRNRVGYRTDESSFTMKH